MIQRAIDSHHLDDPYPVQYVYWLRSLARGEWGYSPILQSDVLEALLIRTPVTLELTFYSLLLFIPLGLLGGVMSAWRQNKLTDQWIRFGAFLATSFPPFILSFFLLSIFYVGLGWFPPDRLGLQTGFLVNSADFQSFTGFMTIDGFLNGLPEVILDAFRHLVLPVFTLSLYHWATLTRVTRSILQDELSKEYILAARARGLSQRRIVWRHGLKNAMAPALTSSILSAASLITGVFVVEIIYNYHGVSDLIVRGITLVPDAPAVLGFAVYSVTLVLLLMLALDAIQAFVDPRYRDEVMHS